MIKNTSSNQSYGRDSESKMVRFLSPSVYIYRVSQINVDLLNDDYNLFNNKNKTT